MKFVKSTATPPCTPRIVLHTGEGLDQYALWSHEWAERQRAARDTQNWVHALSPQPTSPRLDALLFPEWHGSERAALELVFSYVAATLRRKDEVLSIVTRNSRVAQTTIETLVRRGLSGQVHVLWHKRNEEVVHGWFQDQSIAVATEAFELAPALSEEFLHKLDFGMAPLAMAA
jgi:hypothetical protein